MEILRVFLFTGLILHKALWEVLKRKGSVSHVHEREPIKLVTQLVKGVKLLILVFLLFQTLFLDVLPITSDPSTLKIIGTIIYLVGLSTAMIGRIQLGDNWVDLEDYQVLSGQSVVSTGIYRFIRHPIYSGDILLLIGLELALNSWLVLGIVALILVVVRQVLAEETLLSEKLPGYKEYCQQTKMFIPFVV